MNKNKLEFAMDELGFVGLRRDAMTHVIIHGGTGYMTEQAGYIKKGTATRDAKKCRDKWVDCVRISDEVNELLKDW